MQQWERGTVALDAPIERYLPWARLADDPRDSVPITLRGLLTHSAGLPREADFPYWTGPDFAFPSQAQVRVAIREQTPLYPASTTWQYSNLGLTLVGETVEAVSGTPYAEYVDANILGPLGLDDTRAGIPAQLYGQQMAVGWGALETDGTRPEVGLFDPAGITPAAPAGPSDWRAAARKRCCAPRPCARCSASIISRPIGKRAGASASPSGRKAAPRLSGMAARARVIAAR